MNDEELEALKAMSEGTAKGLTASIHQVIENLAGSASAQIGDAIGDEVFAWRLRRAERIGRGVITLTERAGVNRRMILDSHLPDGCRRGTRRRPIKGPFRYSRHPSNAAYPLNQYTNGFLSGIGDPSVLAASGRSLPIRQVRPIGVLLGSGTEGAQLRTRRIAQQVVGAVWSGFRFGEL